MELGIIIKNEIEGCGPMTYKCGEKPGKGWYVCLKCEEDLYLDENTDTLPPCAKCSGCEFKKK